MSLTPPHEKPEEFAAHNNIGTQIVTKDGTGSGTAHQKVLITELQFAPVDFFIALSCIFMWLLNKKKRGMLLLSILGKLITVL